MTARDQWQILQYCDASWPFSPCFLLTLRNPLFFGVFGIHYNTIIAIPNAPKPNSRKWTSCFFTGKSTQNGVNCQKGRSCQLKRHKKRQSTRSKMPLQSLIFFFLMHALNLLWLKRKIRDCLQPICYVWLSDMEQL